MKGCVFNIERFAIHDGEGIRTLIFMKGCPLRCLWCSNPESQDPAPELFFSNAKCLGYSTCGNCIAVCPTGAIQHIQDRLTINRDICCRCGNCTKACPAKALELSGSWKTAEELLDIVMLDTPFYRRSGGGVTVSGGEPLMQADFVAEFFSKCHDAGLNTTLETCGCGAWEALEKVCRHTDAVLYDIKHMDEGAHQKGAGASPAIIINNLCRMAERFPLLPVTVRTPVIPGFNCSVAAIREIADFIATRPNVKAYSLLPYHSFGESKYGALGRKYPMDPKVRVQPAVLSKLQEEANLQSRRTKK